jgi:aminoglycoside phosphotransferase (APT) family kinase protein
MEADTEFETQLLAMLRARTGDPAAAISGLTVLPGHAGQSYGFELTTHDASGAATREHLVIRLAPAGVRPVGTADVARQARIMKSLEGTAVPTPPVKWIGEGVEEFGRPWFVVGFVAGDKLALGEREYSPDEQRAAARAVVRTHAALHSVPWEPRRAVWGEPVTLQQEIERCNALLDRPTLDPATTVGSAELRERLLATEPRAPRLGCVHGDMQWSNMLIRDGEVRAVIDWELAQIGAVLIDLGWLCLFSDPDSWVDRSLVPAHIPSPEALAEMYRGMVSFEVTDADVRWFRAFSGYRFGAITAFNLMLHRRGKRIDPTWEDIGLSAARLFARGRELLG